MTEVSLNSLHDCIIYSATWRKIKYNVRSSVYFNQSFSISVYMNNENDVFTSSQTEISSGVSANADIHQVSSTH